MAWRDTKANFYAYQKTKLGQQEMSKIKKGAEYYKITTESAPDAEGKQEYELKKEVMLGLRTKITSGLGEFMICSTLLFKHPCVLSCLKSRSISEDFWQFLISNGDG